MKRSPQYIPAPIVACPECGKRDYWQEPGGGWDCAVCNPPLPGFAIATSRDGAADGVWQPADNTEAGMDRSKRAVYAALWPDHVGRSRAVARDVLQRSTNVADREMRDVIVSLIEQHGVPIGTSLGTPHGYYVIRTREEAADAYSLHRRYGLASLRRASAISKLVDDADRRRIQMELPLETNTEGVSP